MITAEVIYWAEEEMWVVRFYNGYGDLIGTEWFDTEAAARRRAAAVESAGEY